jgi:LmeA-like phospholipid-binding
MAESYPPHQRSFLHSWAFKVPVIIIVILLLLWAVTEIAGPPIAEAVVKKMIQDRYPQATDPYVSISAFPALKLAFKKYDKLTVVVNSITLQGVNFDRIELTSDEWPAGRFRGVIRPDEIQRFFSLKHSYVIDPQLQIQDNLISVSGKVNVSGLLISVNAVGTLVPLDGRRVFFEPQSVQVAGLPVSGEGVALVQQVMKENPVFTVREDLPYTITQIFVEQGKMVIKGNVDMEKALNIKL